MDEKTKRGRPVLPPGERLDHRVEVRLTAALSDKLRRLGGTEWLRERIRRAKAPPASG